MPDKKPTSGMTNNQKNEEMKTVSKVLIVCLECPRNLHY